MARPLPEYVYRQLEANSLWPAIHACWTRNRIHLPIYPNLCSVHKHEFIQALQGIDFTHNHHSYNLGFTIQALGSHSTILAIENGVDPAKFFRSVLGAFLTRDMYINLEAVIQVLSANPGLIGPYIVEIAGQS